MNKTKSWKIGKGYSLFLIFGIVWILLTIIGFLLCYFWIFKTQFQYHAFRKTFWMVWGPFLLILLLILFLICFVRAGEDSTTLRRQMAVYQAVRDINRTYFKRSDVKMKMGEYSSWLEVHFDPHKQNVRSGAPPMRNNNQQGPKPPMNQMPPQQPQQKPLQVNQMGYQQNQPPQQRPVQQQPQFNQPMPPQRQPSNIPQQPQNMPPQQPQRQPMTPQNPQMSNLEQNQPSNQRYQNSGMRGSNPPNQMSNTPSGGGRYANNSNIQGSQMGRSNNMMPSSTFNRDQPPRNSNPPLDNSIRESPQPQNSNLDNSRVINRGRNLDNSQMRPSNRNLNRPSNIMDDNSSVSRSGGSPRNNNFRRNNNNNSPPQFTPTRSNLGNSSRSRSTPKRGMSAKQRRFYERLQNHKKRKGASPSPIRNNTRNSASRNMEVHYDSQVPEQEKIFDPNKSINLMAQDPYA